MTNRQSNIIFYSVIFLTISALLIKFFIPSAFDGFTKSQEERVIKEAVANQEYNKAIASYKSLVGQHISDGDEYTIETADMYEEIARLYALLGNTTLEQEHYLKSLAVKTQLDKVDLYSFANTYYQLGSIAQNEQKYDQAINFFEKSLSTRLGDVEQPIVEDDGMFIGMQKSRIKYLKLNHEDTIATYKKLAAIHRLQQEYAIAKGYYEKALAASKNTFGEEDVRTLKIVTLLKKM
ncbi:MAG: tetratricopeptide repeat protein [Oceanospirillaceae bacterium]|nr:tetratricopeptide repeat protein [Oceanospirillaceae bacterium]